MLKTKRKSRSKVTPPVPTRMRKPRDAPDPTLVLEGRRKRRAVPRVDASPEEKRPKSIVKKPPNPVASPPPSIEPRSNSEDTGEVLPATGRNDSLYEDEGEEEDGEEEEEEEVIPVKQAVVRVKTTKKKVSTADREKEDMRNKVKQSTSFFRTSKRCAHKMRRYRCTLLHPIEKSGWAGACQLPQR